MKIVINNCYGGLRSLTQRTAEIYGTPMAKLFKLTAYLTDIDGSFGEQDLEDYIMWRLRDELLVDHIQLTSAEIGEWHDDHPLNYMDCPEAEYEKYFKENHPC